MARKQTAKSDRTAGNKKSASTKKGASAAAQPQAGPAPEFTQTPCFNGFGKPELQAKPKVRKPAASPIQGLSPLPSAVALARYVWDKKILKVSFLEAEPFAGVIDEIKRVVVAWTEGTLLRFDFVDGPDVGADIRVGFRNQGLYYSLIGSGSRHGSPNGPSMNLGFAPGNKPMHWDNAAERRRLILHEFGHALGLDHEHKHPESRLDVDAAVRMYAPQMQGYSNADIRFQFERLKREEIDARSSPFDIESIMLYTFPKEIYPPNGVTAPTSLSETDKKVIRDIYGANEQFQPSPEGLELEVGSPKKKAYYLFGHDKAVFHFRVRTPGAYEIVVSSDVSESVVDPFARIPMPYDIRTPFMTLDAQFEVFSPDPQSENAVGSAIPGTKFTIQVPDKVDNVDTFVHSVAFDKAGLYFLTAAIADPVPNEPCRFVLQIRKTG